MTIDEHTSTRDLIAQIESKDRRFRSAQAVFMTILLLTLIGVVFVQLRTLAGVQEQLKQQNVLLEAQKKSTDDLKKNTDEQLAKVSNQLDCIAQFFAQRQRQDASITNLEQCTIVRADGSIVQPDFKRGTSAPGTNTTQPATQTPPNSSPAKPGQTPSNPQQPITPIVPTPTPVPDPVEILGIPACVPFTGLCIR